MSVQNDLYVFIGLTSGWTAPAGDAPSIEQIRDNIGVIRDDAKYTIPDSIAGETMAMIEAAKKRQGE